MHINVKRRFNRSAININMTNIDFGYLFRLTDWKLWVKTAKLTYLFKCERWPIAIRYEFDLFLWYRPNHHQFSKKSLILFLAFFSLSHFIHSHYGFLIPHHPDGLNPMAKQQQIFIEVDGLSEHYTLECSCVNYVLALWARCICMEYTQS